MPVQVGQCPLCRAVNSYSAVNCLECGQRLPWADAAQAAAPRQAAQAAPPTTPPAAPVASVGNQPGSASRSGYAGPHVAASDFADGALPDYRPKIAVVCVGLVLLAVAGIGLKMRTINTPGNAGSTATKSQQPGGSTTDGQAKGLDSNAAGVAMAPAPTVSQYNTVELHVKGPPGTYFIAWSINRPNEKSISGAGDQRVPWDMTWSSEVVNGTELKHCPGA